MASGLWPIPPLPGLADAITRAAKDSTLRATLAEKGASQASTLSWDALVPRLIDLYESL